MDIREFLDLPEEQRNVLVELHAKQKRVREQWQQIQDDEKKLRTRKFNLQHTGCEHPMANKILQSMPTGRPLWREPWYDCVCPDCGKEWKEDQ